MPLTPEQKAEIRRRAQAEFLAPARPHVSESTSIVPPDYSVDDFVPDRRSVDAADPAAISEPSPRLVELPPLPVPPPAKAPEPPPEAAPARRKKGRPSLRLTCDQLPGREFTFAEAAEAAGVGEFAVHSAVQRGRPTGAASLVFRGTIPRAARPVVDVESGEVHPSVTALAGNLDVLPAIVSHACKRGTPLKGRDYRYATTDERERVFAEANPAESQLPEPVQLENQCRQLRCKQMDGMFSAAEAAATAGVSKPTIYQGLMMGRPVGKHRLIFWRDESVTQTEDDDAGGTEAETPPPRSKLLVKLERDLSDARTRLTDAERAADQLRRQVNYLAELLRESA